MKTDRNVRFCLLFAASALMVAPVIAQSVKVSATATVRPSPDPKPEPARTAGARAVDLVICLDTSGSMTALIDSARAKLWDIVNELVRLQPNARLRIGLLTYGTPGNSTVAEGWVVRHSDLTTDLDTVYARMMEMTTSGGDEFVGWVLNAAVHTMSWSTDPNAVKLIFVAGNESADQCSMRFNFRTVAGDARARGIIINAIYAGDRNQGMREHWDQVARHGGGEYFAINMAAGTAQVETPYDKVLIELNTQLNATYVPYGERGAAAERRQREQDVNAARMGQQTVASRAAAKATTAYRNESWDLVDAQSEPDFDIAEVPAEALPSAMQPMSIRERKIHVQKMATQRNTVQQKIQEVSRKREVYLRDQRAKQASNTLDEAVTEALQKQLNP